MCRDALKREESCGGHFREEHQTEEGEALRDDENFTNVTVWEYTGEDSEPVAHVEDLVFETVQPTQRSYK
jgi:succinate dehydrogenase / fumarate reductase flavoprotein subunit